MPPPITPNLPKKIDDWFGLKGWQLRPHQIELLEKRNAGQSTLLIAPTGAGKTLAGFLPTLVDLETQPASVNARSIHTLYISPLKALAVDIERNLMTPIEEMGLSIRVETRTGDTPIHKRQRQKQRPPEILLTTPEQLALLLSHESSKVLFEGLQTVIFDELHSLVNSKRGDLLALGLARLRRLAPDMATIGLSATVAHPEALRAWLVAQNDQPKQQLAEIVEVKRGAKPNIEILRSSEHVPWKGHTARYAIKEVYQAIQAHKLTLIFVNTRFQAELMFQQLWEANTETLPIALHHGSLDVAQRRKVEKAMSESALRAVVSTSTLELGIDWGDVDLVVHIGAPKGASRLAQRIGRANHRMDEPSKALLVPANRFEVMECHAALLANIEGVQDTEPLKDGALDVLAQHVWGMACAFPFHKDDLYHEVKTASVYHYITPELFDQIIAFVATGGYALKVYDRYARIKETEDGTFRLSHPSFAQQYRLNVGTIVEMPYLRVRLGRAKAKGATLRGGAVIGKVEEYFLESLVYGDTFLLGGRVLRFEGIRDNECIVSDASDKEPKIPSYAGGKFPMSTYLADRVRGILSNDKQWTDLPAQVQEWLNYQVLYSKIPNQNEILVETFPRAEKHYLVAFPFEGRIAHQSLGVLLTKRLERAGAGPMGFVANDYALAIWCIKDISNMIDMGAIRLSDLFDEDMLGDDLDAWLADSWLLKRTFRQCALISGLIEKRHPGKEKTGRQVTISSDLIYDVLRDYEPDHILMQATWRDASTGLLDIGRLSDLLKRIKGNILHQPLERISPLSVPIMLEVGKEPVTGESSDDLLAEAAGLYN